LKMTNQAQNELEELNHELRNACLAIEALLKRMSCACKKYEKELLSDAERMD